MKTLEQIKFELRALSDVYDEFTMHVGNGRVCNITVHDDFGEDYYLIYGPLPWLGGNFEQACEQLANIEKLIEENKSEEDKLAEYYEKYHGTDEFDFSWYSDWHKDVYGFRPH